MSVVFSGSVERPGMPTAADTKTVAVGVARHLNATDGLPSPHNGAPSLLTPNRTSQTHQSHMGNHPQLCADLGLEITVGHLAVSESGVPQQLVYRLGGAPAAPGFLGAQHSCPKPTSHVEHNVNNDGAEAFSSADGLPHLEPEAGWHWKPRSVTGGSASKSAHTPLARPHAGRSLSAEFSTPTVDDRDAPIRREIFYGVVGEPLMDLGDLPLDFWDDKCNSNPLPRSSEPMGMGGPMGPRTEDLAPRIGSKEEPQQATPLERPERLLTTDEPGFLLTHKGIHIRQVYPWSISPASSAWLPVSPPAAESAAVGDDVINLLTLFGKTHALENAADPLPSADEQQQLKKKCLSPVFDELSDPSRAVMRPVMRPRLLTWDRRDSGGPQPANAVSDSEAEDGPTALHAYTELRLLRLRQASETGGGTKGPQVINGMSCLNV